MIREFEKSLNIIEITLCHCSWFLMCIYYDMPRVFVHADRCVSLSFSLGTGVLSLSSFRHSFNYRSHVFILLNRSITFDFEYGIVDNNIWYVCGWYIVGVWRQSLLWVRCVHFGTRTRWWTHTCVHFYLLVLYGDSGCKGQELIPLSP